jgi:hypothetical protein
VVIIGAIAVFFGQKLMGGTALLLIKLDLLRRLGDTLSYLKGIGHRPDK